MKILFFLFSLLAFTSCFNTDNSSAETEQLNLRISRLEQRIDSLVSAGHTKAFGLSNNTENNYCRTSSTTVRSTLRCQATTKKGTQCKRAARNSGYCWQHGR